MVEILEYCFFWWDLQLAEEVSEDRIQEFVSGVIKRGSKTPDQGESKGRVDLLLPDIFLLFLLNSCVFDEMLNEIANTLHILTFCCWHHFPISKLLHLFEGQIYKNFE